jgi:hypothetical protein
MEKINFFTPETPWKKLWEKIPPKGGGIISSTIFIHGVGFFRMEIIPHAPELSLDTESQHR